MHLDRDTAVTDMEEIHQRQHAVANSSVRNAAIGCSKFHSFRAVRFSRVFFLFFLKASLERCGQYLNILTDSVLHNIVSFPASSCLCIFLFVKCTDGNTPMVSVCLPVTRERQNTIATKKPPQRSVKVKGQVVGTIGCFSGLKDSHVAF